MHIDRFFYPFRSLSSPHNTTNWHHTFYILNLKDTSYCKSHTPYMSTSFSTVTDSDSSTHTLTLCDSDGWWNNKPVKVTENMRNFHWCTLSAARCRATLIYLNLSIALEANASITNFLHQRPILNISVSCWFLKSFEDSYIKNWVIHFNASHWNRA